MKPSTIFVAAATKIVEAGMCFDGPGILRRLRKVQGPVVKDSLEWRARASKKSGPTDHPQGKTH
jgi:hypothetical protein